eukprot:TRINITY_DN36233_c0_g1_i1.p1 TRINITY_DN36233_c0_g1~~TRINITY_DN36233_c0_g1_i1.p1  ORF type:complete len:448 (+),score=109.05 TRINITY_DN36233_c0_g1_i1:62-1345(+)
MQEAAAVAAAAGVAVCCWVRKRRRKEDCDVRSLFFYHNHLALCNHGSFGGAPRDVLAEQSRLRERMESSPDEWFRWSHGRSSWREPDPEWLECCKAVADLVGTEDAAGVVLVRNATAGSAAVFANAHRLLKKQRILLTAAAYDAVAIAARNSGVPVSVMPFDVLQLRRADGGDSLCEALARHLDAEPDIGLFVVDHVTCKTAAVLPVARMAEVCRKRGVRVMVDGAHAPGTVDVSLDSLGVDFYVGNLHKWCFCPKGTAFLWVRDGCRESVSPVVPSHNADSEDFQARFWMQGTVDDTAHYCIPAAFRFAEKLGGFAGIRSRNAEMLQQATSLLVAGWQTKLLLPLDACNGTMACVATPLSEFGSDEEANAAGDAMFRLLWQNFGVVCPLHSCGTGEGRLYARISVQVYSRLADYERLRDAVLTMAK